MSPLIYILFVSGYDITKHIPGGTRAIATEQSHGGCGTTAHTDASVNHFYVV